jgi:hypothetical protein
MTDSINNPYVCKLKKSLIIAKSIGRIVYRHPDNPNQCLKIVHHKRIDENKIDIKYYQHLQNRGASFKHIACIRGEQNTNKGNAVIFELIKDYDGEISKTLQYYITPPPTYYYSPPLHLIKFDQLIAKHLLLLKQYLLTERIVFKDLNPGNILLCRINATDIRLIIVDGLASRNLIPIAHYVNFFAVRMIKRRWHKTI